MLKSFSSILLIFISLAVSAQNKKADTVKVRFWPTGVRLGGDLITPIKAIISPTFRGWEVNADVDLYKYYVALDYGAWGRNYVSDLSHYSNSGTYYRIGIDINLLKKDPDKNMFFFGVRYGASSFSETLITSISDPIWGSKDNVTYTNPNARGYWFELVTGLRVKIWEGFWMGYTARFKFALSTSNTPAMVASDVPGYGRNDGDGTSTWGFNYQLFWRIPFTKDPLPLPK